MNSADIKQAIKYLLYFTVPLVIFVFILNSFQRTSLIRQYPQVSAILALGFLVIMSYLKLPADICFLLCGIMSCFIMQIPLEKYTYALYNQASSDSIFLIVLSGALFAALSRNDLTDRSKSLNEHDVEMLYQIKVFCVFDNLNNLICTIRKKNKIIAALIYLIQNMLMFVSSVASASMITSMMPVLKDKRTSDKERSSIQAGILCMCIVGCLLVYFPFLKSPWWLLFTKGKNTMVVPYATMVYALFSFVHGYYLMSVGGFKIKEDMKAAEAGFDKQLTKRYLIIFIGIIIVFLSVAVFTPLGSTKNDMVMSKLNTMKILVLILVAVIISTVITSYIMSSFKKSSSRKDISRFIVNIRKLILGDLKNDAGIKSVISTITLIVTILAFKDMIQYKIGQGTVSENLIKSGTGGVFNVDSAVALTGCLIILAAIFGIGIVLGSNFGAFSIGLIFYNIFASKVALPAVFDWQRWMLECLVIVSTFCNQVSKQSSNAMAVVLEDESPQKIQTAAWGVQSFIKTVSAYQMQFSAMVICVLISAILTGFGVK